MTQATDDRVEALIAEGEDGEFPVTWRTRVGQFIAEIVYEEHDHEHANPRGDCANLGTMVCWHPDYYLGDEQIANADGRGAVEHEHEHSGRFKSVGALARWATFAKGSPVVLPLYLYEHSGISLSCGTGLVLGETPKGGYDEFGSPRGWDTTLCGVIYTTREKIAEFCGEGADGAIYCPPDWTGTPEQWIAKALREEVELYDRYLRGEVYGWTVREVDLDEDGDETDDGDSVDGCYGYLPDVSVPYKDELRYIKQEAVEAALSHEDDRIKSEAAEAVERARGESGHCDGIGMTMQLQRQRKYVLLVDVEEDYDPADVYGPFASVDEAAAFAEDIREENGLPREATPENNDTWTERGWYFGIFELRK